MPIPLAQLNTWSNQGAIVSSSAAYASIRRALAQHPSLEGKPLDIFLQGSYANDTNIYGDSDVDVVVVYQNAFYKDLSLLPLDKQALHEQIFSDAGYNWYDLKRDVLAALEAYYGRQAVVPGNKSIKVHTRPDGRPSDVIPALQFRRYAHFNAANDLSAHWGIQFFDVSNSPIVNYPKYHIERGVEKNKAEHTSGTYKRTVRVFKNLRNHLVDRGLLHEGAAPSYFIECALHNVTNTLFSSDYSRSVPAIADYLLAVNHGSLLSQNGVTPLIGPGPTQWSSAGLNAFLLAIKTGWDSR
jgi:hypothetical protein